MKAMLSGSSFIGKYMVNLQRKASYTAGGLNLDKTEFGNRLRAARREKGYTQEEFAEIVGISSGFVSEIERGLKTPSIETFTKIIEALGTSGDYVLVDYITCGQNYVYDELTEKLKGLTPRQRKTAADILNAYINNKEEYD